MANWYEGPRPRRRLVTRDRRGLPDGLTRLGWVLWVSIIIAGLALVERLP